MQPITGKISRIGFSADGDRSAQVDCTPAMSLRPGQYLHAHNSGEADAALGITLFPVGLPAPAGFPSTPARLELAPVPRTWDPGTRLEMRGPLGNGFTLPKDFARLALVAFGGTAARLLPLIPLARARRADIVLFSDQPPAALPAEIEIQPLATLPEAIPWADFWAFDLPVESLPALRETLALPPHAALPAPAQALVTLPMPCAGIGECGACAVPLRRGKYALACKNGPVFNLNVLAM